MIFGSFKVNTIFGALLMLGALHQPACANTTSSDAPAQLIARIAANPAAPAAREAHDKLAAHLLTLTDLDAALNLMERYAAAESTKFAAERRRLLAALLLRAGNLNSVIDRYATHSSGPLAADLRAFIEANLLRPGTDWARVGLLERYAAGADPQAIAPLRAAVVEDLYQTTVARADSADEDERFLAAFPESPRCAEILRRLEQRRLADARRLAVAGDYTGYLDYLKRFPVGEGADEARRQLEGMLGNFAIGRPAPARVASAASADAMPRAQTSGAAGSAVTAPPAVPAAPGAAPVSPSDFALRQEQVLRSAPRTRLARLEPTQVYSLNSGSVVRIQSRFGTASGAGSGFIISGDGFILTNRHVISDESGNTSSDITATVGDKRLPCRLVHASDTHDIAMLKIDGSFVAVGVGDSAAMIPGEYVFAMGNPEGQGLSITRGEFSGLRDKGELQISTPISNGSSGGPVFNQYGEAVGVASRSFVANNAQNLNFAIALHVIMPELEPAMTRWRAKH